MNKTLLHILMHNGRLLERAVELELTPTGLHHGQGRMLLVIAHNGEMTQADLARRMDIKPATVTNMLKPLEKKKLIRRKIDPKTNRAIFVSLTQKGAAVCGEVELAWDRVEAGLVKPFSKEELDGFFQCLETLRRAQGGKHIEEKTT